VRPFAVSERFRQDAGRRWRRARLRRLAAHARRAIWTRYDDIYVVVKALDGTRPPTDGRRLRVETADARHAEEMAALFAGHDGFDMTARELTDLFTARLADGPRALLCRLDDELIGFLWWADAEAMPRVEPLLNVRFGARLGPRDIYAFGLFVTPEHRADGTSTWFLTSAEAELARLGYARLLGYVLRANRPARWLFAITGHESLGPFESQVALSRILRVNDSLYLARRDGFEPVASAWKRRRAGGARVGPQKPPGDRNPV
jgi:GNAT superfamily N-acetyltransferase